MTIAVLAALVLAVAQTPRERTIVVASKPFGESYILCEMFAQLLEARGFRVDRRPGLGATEIAFAALRTNAIDVYPEYTGTGLLAILGDTARRTPAGAFTHVATEFRTRYGARWLPPLGFENTYAISVRRETASRLGLRTLTDLARVASALRAGFTADFIGRNDGLPGLTRAYGLTFRSVRPLLGAVKYQALASGDVDVIDGYSTDGLIARYDLVVLIDDRGFFPPYQAAALVSPSLANDSPRAIAALTELSGRIDAATMRDLNRRLEVDGAAIVAVARAALDSLGLVRATAASGASSTARATTLGTRATAWQSFVHATVDERGALAFRTLRHLMLSALSLVAAGLIGIPFALALERRRTLAEPLVRATGLLQTIPGIALLAFMIPLLGIGIIPALVALFVYSLYPIVRNTYSGVRDADAVAVNAAHALGMTASQVLRYVRLPLAAPTIMAGVRTAAVINVGTATLAAFIGAGGLGEPIVTGLALSDTGLILSGAVPAALLALLVDLALGFCERAVRPRGLGSNSLGVNVERRQIPKSAKFRRAPNSERREIPQSGTPNGETADRQTADRQTTAAVIPDGAPMAPVTLIAGQTRSQSDRAVNPPPGRNSSPRRWRPSAQALHQERRRKHLTRLSDPP